MKNLILISFILTIFSCKDHPAKEPKKVLVDSITLPVYEVHRDSVISEDEEKVILVLPGEEDTLQYTRSEFDALKKNILEDSNGFILAPDSSYFQNEIFVYTDAAGRQKKIQFLSEAGRDSFYETYASFLRSRNGIAKFRDRRKKTIEIFRIINQIFHGLRHGGTYYGHQYLRILGYAEYSIYKYTKNRNYYNRNANFTYQKKDYIDSLRQAITKGINSETGIPKNELSELRQSLVNKVDNLDKLLSDYFYLLEAREFQSAYYR